MTDLELALQEAEQIYNQYLNLLWFIEICIRPRTAKKCALIDVQNTLNANPHSNPFNTEGSSNFTYWLMVKSEIEKL